MTREQIELKYDEFFGKGYWEEQYKKHIVEFAFQCSNGGKPIVSRSPLFGIFSFAGGRYVGYWSSYEAAEQVMHDEYNDDEWYVDELVCQDCG